MNILLVHNRYRSSGGEDQVFRREGELLRSAGHKVIEYTRDNSEIRDEGILNKAKLGAKTVWAWDSQRELRVILRKERPQLAHFHNTFPLISPAAYYACQEAGVAVVQSLHNARLLCAAANFYRKSQICQDCVGKVVPWPGLLHSCYHESIAQSAAVTGMLAFHRLVGTWQRRVDAYIAFTEVSRDKFIAAGLPPEKVFLKPHFLDDPGVRTQRGGDYALYVGRLAPEKGVGTLVEAWKVLGGLVPLRIVGDGPDKNQFEKQKGQAQLSSISFDGWIAPEQVLSVMKRAAFLIFPSQTSEAFGLAIIEAFACSVPVVTSGLGSTAQLVEDGKTGLHFDPHDAQDLAAKVEWMWTHAKEVEAMGRAARLEYEMKYTTKRNYELLMQIYENILATRARRAA